jgi:hypothetical protein
MLRILGKITNFVGFSVTIIVEPFYYSLMAAYDSVTITWVKTRYRGVAVMEDCYFYAVTKGNELRYIGESYASVLERVKKANHLRKKYTHDLTGCWVWFGYLTYVNFDRLTHKRVLDIESLLIRLNQPITNIPHKKNYRKDGRQDLVVRCNGCSQMLPSISVRNGNIAPKTRIS